MRMRFETPGHTLQPTALVHEVYLRLQRDSRQLWDHPRQFYAAASEAMRRILVEHARRRNRLRHGGGLARLSLESVDVGTSIDPTSMIALSEALDRLEQEQPRKAQVVKLRYFAGLSIRETSELLGICPATVKNHWAYSRAWLLRAMADSPPD